MAPRLAHAAGDRSVAGGAVLVFVAEAVTVPDEVDDFDAFAAVAELVAVCVADAELVAELVVAVLDAVGDFAVCVAVAELVAVFVAMADAELLAVLVAVAELVAVCVADAELVAVLEAVSETKGKLICQ
jgi:hypothetical protein